MASPTGAWPGDAAEHDAAVRAAAFAFLKEKRLEEAKHDRPEGLLPRAILERGFDFRGTRVPLIGPQGIFKPRILPDMPLTITTVPAVEGKAPPYADERGPEGLLRYRYRGSDPMHRDNVGLRLASRRAVPLIYLYGIVPGRYLPEWPAYVVGDEPGSLTFTVAVDDPRIVRLDREALADRLRVAESHPDANTDPETEARRRYVTRQTIERLHQRSFSERVLRAYRDCCAVCRLRHRELLDAAHILPDGHPKGEPIVSNGIALCRLHHAAYDRHILGVRPDLAIVIKPSVLKEKDGPMLIHGLQGFQGERLRVPRASSLQPNPDFLSERYEMFRRAG